MFTKTVTLTLILLLILAPMSQAKVSPIVKGTLIGAGTGAALGLTTSLVIANKFSCRNNPGDENCASGSSQAKIIGGSTVATTALGAGIGALVGTLIKHNKKKSDLAIMPQVSLSENQKPEGGIFLTKSF